MFRSVANFMKLLEMQTFKNFSLPVTVVFLICISVGLTEFLPIYPDEVAYKIFLERFFINGGFKQSVTPFCEGEFLVRPGTLLIPAAAFWSLLNKLGGGWISYRIGPCLGLLALYAVLIYTNLRRNVTGFWPILLFLTLGPAVYGIILLRPEIIILSLCMILYLLGESMLHTRKTTSLFVQTMMALLLFSFCVYVHPKALYLVVLLGGMIGLSMPNLQGNTYRVIYLASSLVLLLGITQASISLHQQQFMQCKSLPPIEKKIEAAMGRQSVNPLDALRDHARFLEDAQLAFGAEALQRTIDRMTYRGAYQIQLLPDIKQFGVWEDYANFFIQGATCFFILYTAIKFLACLVFLRGAAERKRFYLVGLVCISISTIFLLNITKNFYEVSFLMGGLTIMATLLWSFNLAQYGKYQNYGVLTLSVVMVFGAALCIFISWENFIPAFLKGYEGPGISYQTQRKELGQSIRTVLAGHFISKQEPIIVDDITYESVRDHPIVMPITYLGFISDVPGAIAYFASKYHVRYGVVRCSIMHSFSNAGLSRELLATVPYIGSADYPLPENDICIFRLK